MESKWAAGKHGGCAGEEMLRHGVLQVRIYYRNLTGLVGVGAGRREVPWTLIRALGTRVWHSLP